MNQNDKIKDMIDRLSNAEKNDISYAKDGFIKLSKDDLIETIISRKINLGSDPLSAGVHRSKLNQHNREILNLINLQSMVEHLNRRFFNVAELSRFQKVNIDGLVNALHKSRQAWSDEINTFRESGGFVFTKVNRGTHEERVECLKGVVDEQGPSSYVFESRGGGKSYFRLTSAELWRYEKDSMALANLFYNFLPQNIKSAAERTFPKSDS